VARNSLQRLYPQFSPADHDGWTKVYDKARKGAPDALKAVGFEGEPAQQPVCKSILTFIAGGKKGLDIRSHFEAAPYGWSRDATDGGLQVLMVAGLIHAQDDHGKAIHHQELERKAVGKVFFKVEATTITTAQRIQIRKLFQKLDLRTKQGEELVSMPQFLQKLMELADFAGGDAPLPVRPDTTFLEDIRLTAGNEQLLMVYNRREELSRNIIVWRDQAQRINKREPQWQILKRLLDHSVGLKDAEIFTSQVTIIRQQRQLLAEPDPISPLITGLTQLFRDELNRLKKKWNEGWQVGERQLNDDQNWQKLEPEQRLLAADCPAVDES